nr:MAG TPA: hypothetical protein [Caudoviricetes sp.]
MREEYLYSYPSTELNLSKIKFSFLQHSVVCSKKNYKFRIR